MNGSTAGGLAPVNFPAGSTRYLDVTQGGATVLTARLPLYGSVFSISPPSEVPGNLTLADSSATAGNILKGGALFLHNFGTNNAFLGSNAGNISMTGDNNTVSGASALYSNTNGNYCTANGAQARKWESSAIIAARIWPSSPECGTVLRQQPGGWCTRS